MGLYYFSKIDECLHCETTAPIKYGPQRVKIIRNCSRIYNDNIYCKLKAQTDDETFHFIPIDHVLQYIHHILTWNNY